MPAWADPTVGVLYIPAINLVEPITPIAPVYDHALDEYDRYVIGEGVQWLSDSAWLDTPGRVVLAGHTPGVFDDLVRAERGDQIVVFDAKQVMVYEVTGVFVVKASTKEWLRESSEAKLLIITCSGAMRLLIEGKPHEP